ncbi:MAG: hypothetical protein J6X20_06225 [Bacteroidales bacterium]|nr:hypothetical protein [Bacteroidales bacterium]
MSLAWKFMQRCTFFGLRQGWPGTRHGPPGGLPVQVSGQQKISDNFFRFFIWRLFAKKYIFARFLIRNELTSYEPDVPREGIHGGNGQIIETTYFIILNALLS